VTLADRDAELNRLKALAEKLANKVNAPGDTQEVRLGAVVAALMRWPCMASVWAPPWAWPPCLRTPASTTPGSRPTSTVARRRTLYDIEATVERLDGHGATIANSIHPQSVPNRLFD
jgi:hypothetical protein